MQRRTLKELGGWSYLSFLETKIKAELSSVVEAVEQEVEWLGGPAA